MAINIGDLILKVKTDNSAIGKLGGAIGSMAKTAAASAAAASAAMAAVGAEALKSYSSFEQLSGGVEKLYGDAADIVMKNANNAFSTVQMSANQYMETATQFSASLIKSLDGDMEKAAEYTDKAMQQMADNASVFGTEMEQIETAYKGFARGSFLALDNLKLGYSGTKTGMQELLKDAKKYAEEQGEYRDFSIDSYADIIDAIDLVQKHQNIAGNAAKEAAHTIEGSLNSTKAAWANFTTALASGEGVEEAFDNVVDSAKNLASNVLPVVKQIVESMWNVIQEEAPALIDKTINLVTQQGPKLIQQGIDLMTNIYSGIDQEAVASGTDTALTIVENIVNGMINALPVMLDAGTTILLGIVQGIADNSGSLIDCALNLITTLVEGLFSFIDRVQEVAPKIIASLVKGIVTRFPDIIKAALNIVLELKKGLINSAVNLATGAAELIGKLCGFIVQNLPKVKEKAKEIVDKIKETLTDPQAMLEAGKAIVNNLLEGLKSAIGAVWDWVKGTAGKIKDAFTGGFSAGKGEADGTHANGLDRVPRDGYKAILHKDEAVLTAAEAEVWRKGLGKQGNTYNVTINVPNNNNALDTAIMLRDMLRKENLGMV